MTDYYAFEMRFNNQLSVSNENSYLCNGKEFQDEIGLDWYDYEAGIIAQKRTKIDLSIYRYLFYVQQRQQ